MGLLVVGGGILGDCADAAAPAEPAAPAGSGDAVAPDGYVQLPTEEDRKKYQFEIGKTLLGDKFAPGQRQIFEDYYTKYALPRWTLYDSRTGLTNLRDELTRNLRSSSGEVHDYLATLSLDYMAGLARRADMRPAVRFNAMLMIGELNATEARSGATVVPLPAALPILVQAAADPQQPDAVKVAAMVGILRHLEVGGVQTPEARASVSGLALALATAKPAAGQTEDAHAWLKKQAAEALGALGAVGDNGAVAATLAAMVADTASPFYIRCSAAEALGKLNYTGASGLDFAKLAIPLGQLAVDAFAAESKAQAEAEAREKAQAAGVLPRPAMPLPGGSGVPVPIVLRSRLKSRLNAAAVGLKPLVVAAQGAPAEKLIASMQKQLEAILAVFDDVRTDDAADLAAMMETIAPQIQKLRAMLVVPAG